MKLRYDEICGIVMLVMSASAWPYGLGDAARETGLSESLIRSIALEESRHADPVTGAVRPWPWTLNVGGEGHFFATRDEAAAALREVIQSGRRNVDIGALQVNWRWHGDLVDSPEDLLDPAVNLWAFSQVIRECQSRVGRRADYVVACYHTGRANSERGRDYAYRVFSRMNQHRKLALK